MKKVKLKDISTSVSSGLTPLRSNKLFWDGGKIPWLKTEQLGVKYIGDTNEKITQHALDTTSIKINPINSLSIAMYGEGKTRGNVSILKQAMTTNQACCNVIINPAYADYEYVYYFLKSRYEKIRSLASGVRKNLNSNDIKNLEIILPNTIADQNNIASVLSAIDSKIELNNKINSELEATAKLIYEYWFVQFDFPDENGRPYKSSGGKMVWNKDLKLEIPEKWAVSSIDEIVPVKDGTHDSPKYTTSGYPLITSKNLLETGIDYSEANLISEHDFNEINKRSRVDTGDILFSMIGSIGTVYKLEENPANFAIKNVALYKTSILPQLKNFLFIWLKSEYMKIYMSNVMLGSIQKFISLGDLRNMPIFSLNNQIHEYSKITNSLFNKVALLKQENQQLTNLRDWLLPMMMNGQVKIKD